MQCPRGCTHAADSADCRRWRWLVMHKGDFELTVLNDNGKSPVITISSCTSATRVLTRARTIGRTILNITTPEANGFYNNFGRHATDVGNQQRERLSLAARRQRRQGPKGALFDAEIGFVSATALLNTRRHTALTVWEFAEAFADEVVSSTTMRRRTSTTIEAIKAREGDAHARAETRGSAEAHRPICFEELARRRRRAGDTSAPVNPPRGRAGGCCEAPACAEGEPKRPRYFCAGCARERPGCSGWYHFECFWRAHRAELRNRCATCE